MWHPDDLTRELFSLTQIFLQQSMKWWHWTHFGDTWGDTTAFMPSPQEPRWQQQQCSSAAGAGMVGDWFSPSVSTGMWHKDFATPGRASPAGHDGHGLSLHAADKDNTNASSRNNLLENFVKQTLFPCIIYPHLHFSENGLIWVNWCFPVGIC